MPESMSLRHQVAVNLADTCIFGQLTDSYGVNVARGRSASGRDHWSVTFCKARNLDGEIQVYAPNFILVKWQTRYKHLPSRGTQKFTSEYEAKQFLLQSFIDLR